MPLPNPNPDEKRPEFIARCMGDDAMLREFPEHKQRAAVCHSQWERAYMKRMKEKAK